MGYSVDREMAMSRQNKEIETEAARQSHYILWCTIMGIPDPCGPDTGYQRIVAMYIKFLISGVNYTNKDGLQAATLSGYVTGINALFSLRGFSAPIDASNPNNMGGIIIKNRAREEDIASQRSPLDNVIFAELQRKGTCPKSIDSDHNLLFGIPCLSRFIGPQVSEYAQSSPIKVDYHVYLSGRKVIKAFTAKDFIFYDETGNIMHHLTDASLDDASKIHIQWRIQKNHQNGQTLFLKCDNKHAAICPVRAALQMVLRARRLAQPDSLPVAYYSQNNKTQYLTGKRIAVLLREAVRVCPNTPKDQLTKYSAHTLRVWACVLLDEAGTNSEFIQSRQQWMGSSYKMYLRDTSVIQDKHQDALRSASQEVIDLIAGIQPSLHVSEDMSTVPINETMGDYTDEMD